MGHRIPQTKSEWIEEIAEAYSDAEEAIPFGKFVGEHIEDKDLFHTAPGICLKFRGIKRTKAKLKKTTEAALSSYVATKDFLGHILDDPHISFAFCYLASHFALDLIDNQKVNEIMDYIEAHRKKLAEAISKKGRGPCHIS
ncbi:MAG: hypothetical protein JJE15_05720 [Desulfobacteraceae bacterium]|nr:hypothetical protein [Desulfobacteraceae bacterium]